MQTTTEDFVDYAHHPMTSRRKRQPRTQRVTLAEVAEAVGVSSITVSRALKHPDMVTRELRDRIVEAATTMGYVRNRAASALASACSMIIVVIVPSLANNVFVECLDGIDRIIRGSGYQMLLGVSGYSGLEEEALLRSYLPFDPDGLLLTGFDHTDTTRALIERAEVPVVHMMELGEEGTYSVGFSQEAAGRTVTEHLLDRSRRRIAFVASQLDPRTLARGRGYRKAMMEAGLYDPRLELMVPDRSSVPLGSDLLGRLLEQAPDIDAVFFCNDDLAQGGLFECARRGIKVPDDLAVAGFNDLPASICTIPTLTSIATPRFDIGRHAAKMLLSLIDHRSALPARVDLGFELKIRESS